MKPTVQQMSAATSHPVRHHVAIVGSGFSGLAVARHLLSNAPPNLLKVSLIEATAEVGGRAKRGQLASGPVELGATWCVQQSCCIWCCASWRCVCVCVKGWLWCAVLHSVVFSSVTSIYRCACKRFIYLLSLSLPPLPTNPHSSTQVPWHGGQPCVRLRHGSFGGFQGRNSSSSSQWQHHAWPGNDL